MKKSIVLLLLASMAVSCNSLPFIKKKEAAPQSQTKAEQATRIDEEAPKPGDIKVIDGVEYIYARNRKFMYTPYEPEYVWIRKDQYSPRIGEDILGARTATKEQKELEKRLGKLEEELKKKGLPPQMAYPTQMVYMPPGMGYVSPVPMVTFTYPSPRMKRRLIVLPVVDQTNYRAEHLGELATKRLVSRLENTGTIIVVDPNTVSLKGDLTAPHNMKVLNELYGVQAILRGTLSDIFTSTSKIEGKDVGETSFAISKLSVDIYNTDTGTLMRQLSGRNPVFLSREKGDLSSEKAKIKAIDLSIEIIAEDMLKTILSLDWHARIASIENGRVYINAGRLSGLEKGSILEAYAPGQQILDSRTKSPLGTAKGTYKGELEVVELFGVDASWAKPKKGGAFSATDMVYAKGPDGALDVSPQQKKTDEIKKAPEKKGADAPLLLQKN